MEIFKTSNKHKALEQKSLWRVIKVVYFGLAIIAVMSLLGDVKGVDSCGRSVSNNFTSTTANASRMARERAKWVEEHGNCEYNTLTQEVLPIVSILVISPVVAYLLYLGLRRVAFYILIGNVIKDK